MKRTCIVLADATRARFFSYEQLVEPDGPHEQLREVADLVDPERHLRPSELFSDDAGGNRGFAFDDHRKAHLDGLDTAFAKLIVADLARVAGDHHCHDVAVVASPRMLGALRHWLEPLRRTLKIKEFDRDYTQLAPNELRERLAELDVIPARPKFAVAHR